MQQKKERKKGKNRRSLQLYPALKKEYNLVIRQDCFDQDYINKLSPDEKDWLNRFNEEYINANFKHKGRRLHRTKKLKRDCENRNNMRNRDIYGLAKRDGRLTYMTEVKSSVVTELPEPKPTQPKNPKARS